MKSKTAKTILISLLISLILIAGASAVILFVLLPQGIISQEWLYHFFISAIPAFAVALLLAIALLWIEHSISSSKAELAEYDSEEIEPGTYDESLQDMPFDSDYSMDSSAVPNDWEYVEEFDSLPKKEQDEIAEKLPEETEEPEAEKELAPFGEFEFDIPSAPIKFKELSAATAAVNFAFHKDTMERPEGEKYIAPTKEQIAKGEFVMHLAPTKAADFEVNPSDAFNALSAKFPKVLHEFGEFIFDIPEAPKKKEVKELSAAKSIVDFTWNKDTMKRPEGEMYIAPTKAQIERGEFIMHLAPTKDVAFGVDPSDAFNALSRKFPKVLHEFSEFIFDIPEAPKKKEVKELSAAKSIVDFTWNKDTMKRPEGEMYIAPTQAQIEKGEFAFALSPVKADADTPSPKAEQTDDEEEDDKNGSAFEGLATLEETVKTEYDIAPKETDELQSEEQVISYEKDSDANIAYHSLPLPEDVESTDDEEEELLAQQEKENNVYTGDFYIETPLPQDEVSANDAYDYLSTPYGDEKPEHIEIKTNESEEAKEVKELSAAKSIVDFTWNKDTMKRPEGEMYIAPTQAQIEKGEFAFALSPVKADTDTPSPKAEQTDDEEEDDKNGSAFESLATLEETVNAEYDIAPKETDELQSEEQVISYEKDSDANIAYPSLPLPEDVESTEEEELLEQQEKENNVYTGDFYIETPLPQDEVSANDAYDYLSTPYGDEKPEHIEIKTNESEEAKEVKELSAAKSIVDFTWNKDTMKRPDGEIYIAPTKEQIARGEFAFALSPVKADADTPSPKAEQTDDEEEDDKNGSAFEGLATLEETVNAEYDIAPKETDELQSEEQVISYEKDSDANIAYPSLSLPEDVESTDEEEELLEQQKKENNVYTGDFYIETSLPQDDVSANNAYDYLSTPYGDEKPEHIEAKEVKELSAAKSIVDFTWNKDTMKRPEGEMYIAPTKEQIARGEFAFALSPVKETTALAHRAPSDVALADTNKGIAVADTNKGVATLESEVSKAYGSLSLPDDVDESEDDEAINEAEKANAESNFVYVPHATVKDGAKHSDAYNALMSLRAEQSANPETFSEEFSSILELEMKSARQLNYELTIARVTSEKTDDIMKLDFEALAFKESDNRICMIFQCQNKQEASALLNMIKEVIQDKSMRIRMAELRGRNIDAAAFSKEILR